MRVRRSILRVRYVRPGVMSSCVSPLKTLCEYEDSEGFFLTATRLPGDAFIIARALGAAASSPRCAPGRERLVAWCSNAIPAQPSGRMGMPLPPIHTCPQEPRMGSPGVGLERPV